MWKTVKWTFIVFLIFVASLYFREQRIPRFLVDMAVERLSTDSIVVSCDGAMVGLRNGITFSNVRVHDRGRRQIDPVVSAKSVSVNHVLRRVCVVGLKYPRLPDSYYSAAPGGGAGPGEGGGSGELEIPELPDFELELVSPFVLGVAPERLTGRVRSGNGRLSVDDIKLSLSGPGRKLSVEGSFVLDALRRRVHAHVRGQAMQGQVRPLLEALDVTSALSYYDAFTDLEEAVPAEGDFDVDLDSGDFRMKLGVKPSGCKYRGVPMASADGILDLYAYTRGTNCNIRFGLDLVSAVDGRGRRLGGRVGVDLTNDVATVSFDARSELRFEDALAVVDVFSPEDFGFLKCESPPVLRVKGRCGTTPEQIGENDVRFEARLLHGAFLGLRLNDLSAEFALRRDTLEFSDLNATGKTGGRFKARAGVSIPGFDGSRATFGLKLDYRGGSLEELADFFDFDLGERHGRVSGWCELDGSVATNVAANLNGRGSIRIEDGKLAQMKLFAGLTEMLADKVPGVGYLVNQSQASADFTITNGVFRSENLYIEGGLVSMKGWGSYDIATDDLDYTVRVQFLKNDSLMGKIVHPITWPFTKLLLEFKATGPLDAPKWEYISILDRIL